MNEFSAGPLVLHVEDNDGDAPLIVHNLTHIGQPIRIQRAIDGLEAMDILGQAARGEVEKPALVLLDLALPYVSGMEVLEWASGQPGLVDVPIVVLTSSRSADVAEICQRLGCRGYLVKPIRTSDLHFCLGQIAGQFLVPSAPSATHAISVA